MADSKEDVSVQPQATIPAEVLDLAQTLPQLMATFNSVAERLQRLETRMGTADVRREAPSVQSNFSTPVGEVPPLDSTFDPHVYEVNPRRNSVEYNPEHRAKYGDMNTSLTIQAKPFKAMLSSTDPGDIFAFQQLRKHYVEANKLAYITGLVDPIFNFLSDPIKADLSSFYPDVKNQPGNAQIKGIGWHSMNDDYVIKKLYGLDPPRNGEKFAALLGIHMHAHSPDPKKKYRPLQGKYEVTHLEMVRVLDLLVEYYKALADSVNEEGDRLPSPRAKYEFPVAPGSLKTERMTVNDAILKFLVPQMRSAFEEEVKHEQRRGMTVIQFVGAIIDWSLKFRRNLKLVASGLESVVKADQDADQHSHRTRDSRPSTNQVGFTRTWVDRPTQIKDRLNNIDQAEGTTFSEAHGASIDDEREGEVLATMRDSRQDYQRGPPTVNKQSYQAKPAANVTKELPDKPCMWVMSQMVSGGFYDKRVHNKSSCGSSKPGHPCPYSHDLDGILSWLQMCYKAAKRQAPPEALNLLTDMEGETGSRSQQQFVADHKGGGYTWPSDVSS